MSCCGGVAALHKPWLLSSTACFQHLPGVCYRLWDADKHLDEATAPEIYDADLAPLVLELALWGSPDGSGLAWLDPPEPDAIAAATQLLQQLGALDAKARITEQGVSG